MECSTGTLLDFFYGWEAKLMTPALKVFHIKLIYVYQVLPAQAPLIRWWVPCNSDLYVSSTSARYENGGKGDSWGKFLALAEVFCSSPSLRAEFGARFSTCLIDVSLAPCLPDVQDVVSPISQQHKILTLHSSWRITLDCHYFTFFKDKQRKMTFSQDCLRNMLSIYILVTFKSCTCISLDYCKAIYLCNTN